jgi:cutinase
MVVGPQLQSALKSLIPGMKTFPVGYAASMATNGSPKRTDQASIDKGVQAFKQASSCKFIIGGGYSQGAAVMHNSARAVDPSLQAKIAGIALFGDTLNKQESGHIKGLPQEKSRVWCNSGDGVCGGALNVNAGHMSYGSSINAAAQWLSGRVKASGKA